MNFLKLPVVRYALVVFGIVLVYSSIFMYVLAHTHSLGATTQDLLSGTGGDAYEYTALAHTMLESHRFALTASSSPEYFRTPAYPIFVALINVVFGSDLAIPFAHSLLVALSALLIFVLGRDYFTEKVGIIAAILFVIDPMTLSQTMRTTTETFFVFILLVAVYVLTRSAYSKWLLLLAGLLMGVLALTRPIGLYIVPLGLLYLLVKSWDDKHKMLQWGIMFSLGAALLLVPWCYRNYTYSGHFSLSSIGPYNILFYNVLEFEYQQTHTPKDVLHAKMASEIGSYDGDLEIRSYKYNDAEERAIANHLKGKELQYVIFHTLSTIPFFLGSDINDTVHFFRIGGALSGKVVAPVNHLALLRHGDIKGLVTDLSANMPELLERLVWLLLCMGSLVTVIYYWLYRKEQWLTILFFFILPLAFAFLTGPVSSPRYRMPAAPFLFILGVYGVLLGIGYVRKWLSNRRRVMV